MSISDADRAVTAVAVRVTRDAVVVDLSDGRTLAVPLTWYPRLAHGTPAERSNCLLIAEGTGIHWPDLDEDLSVEGMLAGRRSAESDASFQRWRSARRPAAD